MKTRSVTASAATTTTTSNLKHNALEAEQGHDNEDSDNDDIESQLETTLQSLIELEKQQRASASAQYRQAWRKLVRLRQLQVHRDIKRGRLATADVSETEPFGLWAYQRLDSNVLTNALTAEFSLEFNVKPSQAVRQRLNTTARNLGLDRFEHIYLFFGEAGASERFAAALNKCVQAWEQVCCFSFSGTLHHALEVSPFPLPE